jgi:superoxide dismutase, Cu-Zn family
MIAVLGAAAYGCSDDETKATGTPDSGSDSGGRDTSVGDTNTTPQDTGIVDSSKPKFTAKVDIRPTSDASVVNGSAIFTEENGEVTVVVTITSGFPPSGSGLRGIHIHANGSCDATDSGTPTPTFAGAAGLHWNPADASHGLPTSASHHLGDMGNIMITDAGTGTLTLVSKDWTVQAGGNSIIGHAVVFHQQVDDGVSQPVGNAGARPGCGIIVLQ